MTMRKSPRQHPDPNQEYVFDDTGREVAVIKDGARMRVSLLDAQRARGQLTDAEIQMQDHIARDHAWRQATAGNRPGFRIDSSAEGQAARAKVFDALAEADDEREAAWKNTPPDSWFGCGVDSEYAGGPDSQFNTGQGSPSRNFGKPPQERDVCTTNDGRKGTIKNGECVALSEDNRTIDQRMADHAEHMRDLYARYQDSVSNAYKTLR
jgi:hypothetical protein